MGVVNCFKYAEAGEGLRYKGRQNLGNTKKKISQNMIAAPNRMSSSEAMLLEPRRYFKQAMSPVALQVELVVSIKCVVDSGG